MFEEFAFLEPGRLALLMLPLALALGYLIVQARRRRYALRFTTVEMLDQVAPDRHRPQPTQRQGDERLGGDQPLGR